MTQTYKYQYNTYPVFSEEMSHEGAIKRFSSFPTPQTVYDYALLGLPKYFPMTREPITPEMVEPFLNSAITDIEMDTGINISPVVHYHSEDWWPNMFDANFAGIRLQKWPATELVEVNLKYPHTNTNTPYQKYTIPAAWLFLRRNRMNIVASVGAVNVSTDNSALVSAGGLFNFVTGFARYGYQPGSIEVVYKAGFEHDKLPSSVVDLIKTWAALNFLSDIASVLFPQSSVSVGIDGVSQSVGFSLPQALQERIARMEKKKAELKSNLIKSFGRTVKMTILGA